MITISTKKATKVKSVIELFMIFPLSPILQFKKLQTINIEICQFKMMQNCLSVVSKHVQLYMCGLELMALGSREKRLYLLSHRVVLFLSRAFANFTCPLQPPTPSPKKNIMN